MDQGNGSQFQRIVKLEWFFNLQGLNFEVGSDGKKLRRVKILFDRLDLVRCDMYGYPFQFLFKQHVIEKGQSETMIEVNVRQENVECFCLDQVSSPKHARSSIQNDTDFRHHQTGGLTAIVGMITSRAKKMELHLSPIKRPKSKSVRTF